MYRMMPPPWIFIKELSLEFNGRRINKTDSYAVVTEEE